MMAWKNLTVSLVLLYLSITTNAENCHLTNVNGNLEKNLSGDGHLYNPNRTETGPISADIFEKHPRLAFLGAFNGKSWFIERTLATYSVASSGCREMGLRLASVNQAELNFLYGVTTTDEDCSWLGGYVPLELSSFVWEWDGSRPTNMFLLNHPWISVAVALDRWPQGGSGLYSSPTTASRFYICACC